MKRSHGENYFCGWYFKCASPDGTLALICASHATGGVKSSSLQLITDGGAWNAAYPIERYRAEKRPFSVTIGDSSFSQSGFSLNIAENGLSVSGEVRFGAWTPLKYDIMGPFSLVPFMECRHSVLSMRHTVDGAVTVNGTTYRFDRSDGYIEGDRGYSFPSEYAWTHCFFDNGSLMLSVADIPVGRARFTGVIGVVLLGGREYRVATYLGAKVKRISGGELVVEQGNTRLTAKLIEKRAHPLNAPVAGAMTRVIRESAACRASYKFEAGGVSLLCFESDSASFEYEFAE